MAQSERVLCAVDFSDQSRRALDFAVAMARWHGAQVTALYVHQLTVPALAAAPFMAPELIQPARLTDAERAHLNQALTSFVAPDRAAGTSVETLVEEDFDVARTIVDRAAELGASALVLGTHGRSGLQRWLLGSTAEKVLRLAACPVVTVPPRAADAVPATEASLRRILCPIDYSDSSQRALDRAVALAREAKARLTIAHVVELLPEVPDMPMPDASVYRAARMEDGQRRLSSACAGVQAAVDVDARLLTGSPHREIVKLAQEQSADLIVMGIHGRGAIDRFLLGSTAQHVTRHAACPVMTIRS